MHIDEYRKENVLSVQEGIKLIEKNIPYEKVFDKFGREESILVDPSFIWNVVKNKKGCLFELGGRVVLPSKYVHKGGIELHIYILEYVNGDIKFMSNNYAKSTCNLEYTSHWNFIKINQGDAYISPDNPFSSVDDFIQYIDNKDWKNTSIIIEEEEYKVTKIRHTLKAL